MKQLKKTTTQTLEETTRSIRLIENSAELSKKRQEDVEKVLNNNIVYVGMDIGAGASYGTIMKAVEGLSGELVFKRLSNADFAWIREQEMRRANRWSKQEAINEWKKKPENMNVLSSFSSRLFYISEGNWFTKKQAVEAHIGTYKEVTEIFDLLFACGYLAERKKTDDAPEMYRVVPDPARKLQYIEELLLEKQQEWSQLVGLHSLVEDEAREYGLKALADERERVLKEIGALSVVELNDYLRERGIEKQYEPEDDVEKCRADVRERMQVDFDEVLTEIVVWDKPKYKEIELNNRKPVLKTLKKEAEGTPSQPVKRRTIKKAAITKDSTM